MEEKIRLVQLIHPSLGRKVALVHEPSLLILRDFTSIYELATKAIHLDKKIGQVVKDFLSEDELDYNVIYEGNSAWKLLPSFDHPSNPYACLVSGTGLTHKNSALNRQMMHIAEQDKLTDSMKMYQWGLDGGQPLNENIGVQPEWFYKGSGTILRAHGEALNVPSYANDGGEEPEVAGVYLIDEKGRPCRIGLTAGNEFSDHKMEQKNYLFLAPSKLRCCSIGPELLVGADFSEIEGNVSIVRQNKIFWTEEIKTGEKNMAHSLANLEYHHFKYAAHRIPAQAHVHFFGADAFSFGQGIQLENGDVMNVHWKGFGRPLQNSLLITTEEEKRTDIKSIG